MNRQKSFENERPTLYLVATPIGNLDEMTYRSINTLKNVKYIAAEDTRNTVKLLNHFEISTKLISRHEHNIKQSIPKLIQLLEEGNDIVIASRFVEEKKPTTARMIGSRLITTAIRLTSGAKIMDPTSGMRMYNKKLIEVLANNINFGPEPDTVSYLIKMGAKVAEIQAKMDERIAGQSYLNAVNAAKYMARMLISILLIQNFRNKKKVDFTK